MSRKAFSNTMRVSSSIVRGCFHHTKMLLATKPKQKPIHTRITSKTCIIFYSYTIISTIYTFFCTLPYMELKLTIMGQIPSGKNAMAINSTTGRHYARSRFSAWKKDAWYQIIQQKRLEFTIPCSVHVNYWPGDRRIRDVPGMMDALCHILETSQIVSNDSLFQDWTWETHPISNNPRIELIIHSKS